LLGDTALVGRFVVRQNVSQRGDLWPTKYEAIANRAPYAIYANAQVTFLAGPSKSTAMVIIYATAPLVIAHHVRPAFHPWRRRDIRDNAQKINTETGTPTMPTNPPPHKAQSTLLQRELFPKELNDACALKG